MESEGKTITQYMRWSCPHKNTHTHTQNTEEKEYYCCNFSQHGFYPTDPIQLQLKLSFLVFFILFLDISNTNNRKKESKHANGVGQVETSAPKGFLEHLHPRYPISLALSRAF